MILLYSLNFQKFHAHKKNMDILNFPEPFSKICANQLAVFIIFLPLAALLQFLDLDTSSILVLITHYCCCYCCYFALFIVLVHINLFCYAATSV